MAEYRKSIHEILIDVRNLMDEILPEGIGVSITSVDYGNGLGKVALTISSWPKSSPMLNLKRVRMLRYAVLDGRKTRDVDLSGIPYLSPEALLVAKELEKLTDQFFPSRIDPSTGQTTWDIETSVVFDPGALKREEIEYIQELKNDPKGPEASRR